MITQDKAWLFTPKGDPRGYIQPEKLKELWFHTGTHCNLSCPFCLEGSSPNDSRLDNMKLEDVESLFDEAIDLGVEQFSFTGGEPFANPDFMPILEKSMSLRPSLVLSNGTKPLHNRFEDLERLKDSPNPLSIRISIDYADEAKHDAGRGSGNFKRAFEAIAKLQDIGIKVSIARQADPQENREKVNASYHAILDEFAISREIAFIPFPDFLPPGSNQEVPHITENCMTSYQTQETRSAFMCAYSKMVVKKEGKVRIYACTLVDDDEGYDQGSSLKGSLEERVMLKHHRCFSCFAYGASCSES